MYLFKRKLVPLLGIDISASSVKLLELGGSIGHLRVESYAVEPLPTGAVSDKTITDVNAVGEAIERVVRKARTKNTAAAVAVSGASVITKIVPVAQGFSEIEMEEHLQMEAGQYIPFPLEEVAMDFHVLGESAEGGAEQVDVMLAASRNDIVDNCVAALDQGGLDARVVDVESFAVDNAVALMVHETLPEVKDGVVAVADIGSAVTTFSVMQGLVTIYSREQPFGGAQLTEEIQRRYGLSYEEAGSAKRRGGLPDNYEPEVLDPFKESMVQEIERAQQFFFSSSALESIDYLILAGGCSSIPGVALMAEKQLNVPTTVADPFANMAIAAKVAADNLAKDAPAMLIAMGLSLRGVVA